MLKILDLTGNTLYWVNQKLWFLQNVCKLIKRALLDHLQN